MAKMSFENAQHLCGVIARFFDNIAECSPEYGEDFNTSEDFFMVLCRDFTFNQDERDGAKEVSGMVSSLAESVLRMAD